MTGEFGRVVNLYGRCYTLIDKYDDNMYVAHRQPPDGNQYLIAACDLHGRSRDACGRCRMAREDHAENGKCLYDPGCFEPWGW